MPKTMTVRATVVAAVCALLLSGQARADARKPVNIPTGDLRQALLLVSEQFGAELVYSPEQLRGVKTAGAYGELTSVQAITKLLEGTPLELRIDPSGAMLIAPKSQREEVIVTGTRLRGVDDVAGSSMTITRGDTSRAGYVSLEEVLEDLPQNFASVSADAFYGSGTSALAQSNVDRASAVDLRGLGPQSTLTLVNGTRRAGSVSGRVVDVSAIPLSAIERIDVITGGRSAIYGSDAVAGVVNLITRRDFTGAETAASYGAPISFTGGERLQLSQIFGMDLERGGFVASYDYRREQLLDLMDTGLARSPTAAGATQRQRTIGPDTSRHSVFLAGDYEINDRIGLHADVLYSHRDMDGMNRSVRAGAVNESFDTIRDSSDQYSVAAGARVSLTDAWVLDVDASTSVADHDLNTRNHLDLGAFITDSELQTDDEANVSEVSLVAEGPVLQLGGITPRLAVGVQARSETFERNQVGTFQLIPTRDRNDRTVRSAFAEIGLPLVTNGANAGLRKLALSLAVRHDDYTDFGGTTNPQVSVMWQPADSVTLRSAWSSSFRAPAVVDLGSTNNVVIRRLPDPARGGAPSPVLMWAGDNADLEAEEAETWSVQIEFRPWFAPASRFSLGWFSVDYDGRIDIPAFGADQALVLQRASQFVDLILRNPSAAQVAAIVDPIAPEDLVNATPILFDPATQKDNILSIFPGLVVFDNRLANISSESVQGIDAAIGWQMQSTVGTWDFAVNGTYTLEHERHLTSTSPGIELLNDIGKPVDLRLRANAGWMQGPFAAFVHLNYSDGYEDSLSVPARSMASWTTVDLTLRYDAAKTVRTGLLAGVTVSLSCDNLLNHRPPVYSGALTDVRYDPANANPLGRYVSLQLVKRL